MNVRDGMNSGLMTHFYSVVSEGEVLSTIIIPHKSEHTESGDARDEKGFQEVAQHRVGDDGSQ